jgi:putative redox protein
MKTVTVESQPGYTYAVTISDGRHQFPSDETQEAGGDNLGPTPYELLLGALGGCMAITLTMYARRREWPLEGVSVELTHEKVFAQDCDYCTQEEIDAAGPQGRIDLIQSVVKVRGDLSPEQVERLHEIANRCPVHRTLENAPKIVSTVATLE